MAYTDFNSAQPDPATQTPGEAFTADRNNLLAMRDSIIGGVGFFPGWDIDAYDASGNTPPLTNLDKPAYIIWSKGASDKVKLTITWGTTGGATDQPTRLVVSWWNGSSYDVIKGGTTNGYCDVTYDTSGAFTSAAWS